MRRMPCQIQLPRKSTNLLCVDAHQALREQMRHIQGRRHELPNADIEDSEDSDLEEDPEEDEKVSFVDLDSIPVEIGAEQQVVEAEMEVEEDEEYGDEDDAHRTGTAPGGISIESHNHLKAPPIYVTSV